VDRFLVLSGDTIHAHYSNNYEMNSNGSTTHHAIKPHLALIAVQIMFCSWAIFGKIVLRSISSVSLVGIRICGAAVIFTLLQRNVSQLLKLPRRVIAWLVLSSLLGIVINQLLFVKGLSLTTAINSTLLSTTIPVFALAISIALGHERASFRHVVGIVLAICGVVYLVDPARASFSAETTLGNILVATSSLFYGAYIAVSRDLVRRYGALRVTTWIFQLSAIFTLPIAIYSWSGSGLESIGGETWLAIGYIVLVPTVLAYYLNAWALGWVAPSVVAIYIYMQPLLAFGVAPMVLGEKWNARTLVACALIFAGVAVVTIGRRRNSTRLT
jgi:drug/metabolite transporter (DMT)-like permease